MKKLSFGFLSIEKIINKNCIYVDKTGLIHSLITNGARYSLLRPQRFGKSLSIDTLKEIFKGNKELFKDCAIYSTDYSWEKHPIIHLDFTQISKTHSLKLEVSLIKLIEKIALENKVSIQIPNFLQGLVDLVKKLSAFGKVVVLIDEYDKPIIDHIDQIEKAKANRDILRDLLGAVQGLCSHLKFVFVTGVYKFSEGSLFSDINNLHDLTMHSSYAELLGYTEKEILDNYGEHLDNLCQKLSTTKETLLNTMRSWCGGYRFSKSETQLYNPSSVMLFLENGEPDNYWFKTANPKLLINSIRNFSYPVELLDPIRVCDVFFGSLEVEKIDLLLLMWRAGYLTIKDYDTNLRTCVLDYPNEEVKKSFIFYLTEGVTGISFQESLRYSQQFREALTEGDLDTFFQTLRSFLACIPYDIHVPLEKYYQTIFYVCAKLIGLDTNVEVKTSTGRIDMTIHTPGQIYILEFKINSTTDNALSQIKENRYFEPYLSESSEARPIVLVGANFATETRTLSEWVHETLVLQG